MDDLADRFADRAVRSVFLYVREAHPAENYRHHTSMAAKRANARAFQSHFEESNDEGSLRVSSLEQQSPESV